MQGPVLLDRRCPCCSEQGALVCVKCKSCGHQCLICDEVGTIYFNPMNLQSAVYGGLSVPTCVCPDCQAAIHGFVVCDLNEVRLCERVGIKEIADPWQRC